MKRIRRPWRGIGLAGSVGWLLTFAVWPAAAQTVVRLPPTTNVAQPQGAVPQTPGPIRLTSAVSAIQDPGASTIVPRPIEVVPLPPPELQPAIPETISTPGVLSSESQLIDLPSAWQLADRANPEIGIARAAILEALARLQAAKVLLLPSLTGGTNYHHHTGNLQRSRGAILSLTEQALYYGGGARTVAAESVAYPAIRIYSHLGDALFEPLAASQQTTVRQFNAGATANSILLAVSTRYVELMGAEARLEVLFACQRDAAEVVRLTTNFARVGQGRQADADRMRTEALLIDSEIQLVESQVVAAAAELARLLNLDPTIRLRTVGGPVPVLELVDPRVSLNELLQVALLRRPELGARNARVAEAETRYRQERTRPLFPTISVGFSAGDFGGGSNLVTPMFGNFAGRTDFDAMAFWTLQNFGVGNAATWRTRRAQAGEAAGDRARMVNLVRREVAEAYALCVTGRRKIQVAEQRLAVAEDGLRAEMNRIRSGEGLPIELLDNLTRAISARQAIVTAIVGYDQAQFQLFVALGQPPTLALPNAGALAAPQAH